ncbi:GNAT family N-acetyltransferase, partial [Pseudomonas viridiflava]|uniref:GNAT family N-acetyltransferase n=1 Tax=Pseudomonas viridiflava TaxID=33069 RepID=UPI0013DD224C
IRYATGKAGLVHAFETLRLPDVYGLVRPDHAASIKVLEKIGMQRIGIQDDVPGKAPSLVFKASADAFKASHDPVVHT